MQRTGSFKARGALNWMLTAQPEELEAGLITVSAGNHAIALAWAAAMREVPLTVVMPEGSSPLKIARTRDLGASVGLAALWEEGVPTAPDAKTVLLITGGNLDLDQVPNCMVSD